MIHFPSFIFHFNEGLKDYCLEEDKGENVGLGNPMNAIWHGRYVHIKISIHSIVVMTSLISTKMISPIQCSFSFK